MSMKTRPLLPAFLILSLGILASFYCLVPIHHLFILSAVIVLITLIVVCWFNQFKVLGTFLFWFAFFIFGSFWFRFQYSYQAPDHIAKQTFLYEQPLWIKGLVVRESHRINPRSISLFLQIREIYDENEAFPVSGKIFVTLPSEKHPLEYGTLLLLKGEFEQPPPIRNPGAFNFSKYLALQKIYTVFKVEESANVIVLARQHSPWLWTHIVIPIQKFIRRQLAQLTPTSTGNFLKGLLLGQKADIHEQFIEALAKTGTSHILAVSGLHTGFILLILWLFFRVIRLPQTYVVIFTILGLILYAFITNLKPPVVRSLIMASIFLIGTCIQRFRDHYNTLAAAALIILFLNPLELFNPGFQLSFSAVFSILYFYPKLTGFLQRTPFLQKIYTYKIIQYLVNLFMISLAVQLGTLPFIIKYFQLIPLVGILANIVVVPLIGIVMAIAIVAIIISPLSMMVALNYMEVNNWLVYFITSFIEWIAYLPLSFANVPPLELSWIVLYYSGLLLTSQWFNRRLRKWCLGFILIFLNFLIWKSILFDVPHLRITHFDVGQGDAALIELPHGQTVLIDAGQQMPEYDSGERIISPYLKQQGIHHLDFVVLTHPHSDHLGGIPYLLTHFSVGQVFDNNDSLKSPLFEKYQRILDSLAIRRQAIGRGYFFQPAPGAEIWVFHPFQGQMSFPRKRPSINNNSIVLKLNYRATGFLFTGDAERETEAELLQFEELLSSDILKVGHHGSATSSTDSFLQCIKPQFGVVSVGEHNRFNQPSLATLERLAGSGIQILRTDQAGAIVFESDGKQIKRVLWQENIDTFNSIIKSLGHF